MIQLITMKKNFLIFNLFILLFLISGCQTIKEKSDAVAAKENEKYGQFVGKQVEELKIFFTSKCRNVGFSRIFISFC